MKKIIPILFLINACTASTVNAQLVIYNDTNTVQLVNDFILTGVTASNIVYTGAANTLGTFNNGNVTNIGLTNGIIMTTGLIIATPIGSPASNFASIDNLGAGCMELNNLSGNATYNASILEFDLIPVGNILEFQYVFASEEYPEYVFSNYNDVFAFFIDGTNPLGGNYIDTNIAIIPGSSLPVAINNVNATLNSAYFIDNEGLGGQSIVFDGFTTVLLAQIIVIPGNTYHLKMAIADVADGIYDSGIFLKAQSMKSYNGTVGIDNIQEDHFSIFPNPAKDKIEITVPQKSEIQILNTEGQVLKNISGIQNQVSIDVSDLASGIYFIRIDNNDENFIKKFAKE
jgi:hypothetical protein